MSFVEIFLIGLIAGFLFYELTGISAGGVVAPAYFAISINQPGKIGVTVLIAFAVYAAIRFFSARLIIYGRRRLLFALVLGFFLKLLLQRLVQPNPSIGVSLQSIGYIIPGLVGNEMYRQGTVPTLLGLAIVSIFIYLLTLVI
ncbi:MAG: poly-gamma-glutamate biosynthesis protein PgsC [Candidatus Latescibacteria bacterium]|nr:poly-gamma-glutamate biosynthesis protein PgsC [bacterium]MBD3425124.1 poly-gamma-glutamate biosynthesis protein PgsC [Candidatus Latescibacterota bacterium]